MFDSPDVEAIRLQDGREGYRLVHPWHYVWETNGVRRKLTVPEGYEYDGASIPRLLWTLLGLTPAGLMLGPALAHDALYKLGGQLPEGWLHEQMPGAEGWCDTAVVGRTYYARIDVDRLFARIMRDAGVKRTRRKLAFFGVRCAGWLFWEQG